MFSVNSDKKIEVVLAGIDRIPRLVFQTQDSLFCTFIEGQLLPEVIDQLGISENILLAYNYLKQ